MFRIFLAALGAMLLACPVSAAPIEAYGRLPTLEQVQVSPNGARLAYVQPNGESRKVLVQDLATGRTIAAIGVGDDKLRDLIWAGDNHIAFSTSTTSKIRSNDAGIFFAGRSEVWQTRVYDIEKRTFQLVLDKTPGVGNFTNGGVRVRTTNGQPSLYAVGLRLSGVEDYQSLYRIDVLTATTRLLESGPTTGSIRTNWVLDGAGASVARTEYDSRNGAWRLMIRQGTKWTPALEQMAVIDEPNPMGLGAEPDTLLLQQIEGEEETFRLVSLKTGKLGEKLKLENGVDDFIFDPVTKLLIGVVEGDAARTLRFFAPADQAAWSRLARAFPGERLRLESWSDNRKQVVVRVEGKKTGAAYMLVDLAAGRASIIDDMQAGVTAAEIAPSQMITYKAGDGLSIEAVLTLPNGRAAKGLPLVVLPHGGPQSTDTIGYDWWSQAVASRGYAVLRPNFRGSAGYGPGFVEAGHGEWGRKMQTDLSDGVNALAAQGVIDPKRVCITGASYGGYAALAGAALQPGVYRCAISVAGISDLRRFLVWKRARIGGGWNDTIRYWHRFMGVTGEDETSLAAISPAAHAAAVRIPILLIHGKDDLVVPFDQSRVMADALTKAGKPVDLLTLKFEDHWLSRGATRLEMLQATVSFLEKHNPPL